MAQTNAEFLRRKAREHDAAVQSGEFKYPPKQWGDWANLGEGKNAFPTKKRANARKNLRRAGAAALIGVAALGFMHSAGESRKQAYKTSEAEYRLHAKLVERDVGRRSGSAPVKIPVGKNAQTRWKGGELVEIGRDKIKALSGRHLNRVPAPPKSRAGQIATSASILGLGLLATNAAKRAIKKRSDRRALARRTSRP